MTRGSSSNHRVGGGSVKASNSPTAHHPPPSSSICHTIKTELAGQATIVRSPCCGRITRVVDATPTITLIMLSSVTDSAGSKRGSSVLRSSARALLELGVRHPERWRKSGTPQVCVGRSRASARQDLARVLGVFPASCWRRSRPEGPLARFPPSSPRASLADPHKPEKSRKFCALLGRTHPRDLAVFDVAGGPQSGSLRDQLRGDVVGMDERPDDRNTLDG